MNDLSLFLYLADVLVNLGDVLAPFAILCGVIAVVGGVITGIAATEGANISKGWWRTLLACGVASIVMAILSTLIPSRETMYAIAASEFGEEVLRSPTGGKAMMALEAWLDSQIKGVDETEG